MKSLKDKLYEHLQRQEGYVHAGELERLVQEWGYMGSTATRTLRTLKEEGKIEKSTKQGTKGNFYGSLKKKVLQEVRVDGIIRETRWVTK